MRRSRLFSLCLTAILLGAAAQPLRAQMGFELEVKKPEPYEERVLKAEKTPTDKKIKAPKRFFQNMTTHFNYFFNANNKLNEIIERAKSAHQDDYANLLPFYNYSFDETAADRTQLDSVIYKSQTGIVMHDLRNDWIDNMYMLWGAAYFFRKDFDSASLMFQFINTAFAEKEKDGYYRYIGSRMDGNSANSVSTKESKSILKKVFSEPPSRNDAFIWQIRSLIELDKMTEAGSLISILKSDTTFPVRLRDQLEEVQAYWFYKQKIWDSSANHLVNALSQARTKQEKGRWEYLAAQMKEKTGNNEEALKLYARAMSHGTDPVMEVYARLNLVRLNKTGGENYIDQNVASLVKMAKRDKYADYRDVIYYMAAQMELERNNLAAAQQYLEKAAKYNMNNLSSRNNTFLLIADLSYNQRKYRPAAAFYDSVQTADLKEEETLRVNSRKPGLAKLLVQMDIIDRQDSLQKIASMPEEERRVFVTKLARQLRKQQGLAEESNTLTAGGNNNPFNNNTSNQPQDLFNNASKGEWYFYNTSLKTQGAATFKQNWGNRPNVDNWRRFAAVSSKMVTRDAQNVEAGRTDAVAKTQNTEPENGPSYASLMKKLPLDEKSRQISDDSLSMALFRSGVLYMNDLEDPVSAIEVLERLRSRFPSFQPMDEALFQLYYAYTKQGNTVKAAEIKNLLARYKDSRFATIALTGKDPEKNAGNTQQATRDYEAVYDMFIEGRFNEALAAKQTADSIYKTNRWQPQLLYIEAIYHIRQQNDSTAKKVLQILIAQDPAAPMAKKATTMLDVLSRRAQIEAELRALQIERPQEDTAASVVSAPAPVPAPVKDTVAVDPYKPMVKEKVVLAANNRKTDKNIPVASNATGKTVVNEPAYQEVKRDSLSSLQGRNVTAQVKAAPVIPGRIDTTTRRNMKFESKPISTYIFESSFKHYGVIILNKVDGIYQGEAKNAINRYNRGNFATSTLTLNSIDLDADNKILIIGDFDNAQKALDYMTQLKKIAPTEVLPWLKQDRYSFSIISPMNLELLQSRKDITEYKKFIEQNLPGKF